MAVDALGLAITCRKEEGEKLPVPSLPDQIKVGNDAFLIIVEFDMLAYKKRTNSPAVKKTLSIPQWLNEEAMAIGINFSQVLQEALMQRIQLQHKTRRNLSRGLSTKVTYCSINMPTNHLEQFSYLRAALNLVFTLSIPKRTENLSRSFRSSESLRSQSTFVSRY